MPKLESRKTAPVEQLVFAKNFKVARTAAGLRQQDIQDQTGLSRPYLSDVERHISSVAIDSMAQLSHVVCVPLYCLLDPAFSNDYDFETNAAWQAYEKLIDNSGGIIFERKVFAQNFRIVREKLKLEKKDVHEMTGISITFLNSIERAETGISLEKAVKLAHLVATPLSKLLTP